MTTRQALQPTVLTASWLLPVSSAPVPRGCLCVREERIAWLGPQDALPLEWRTPAVRRLDLGNAVLLPGLVNVHTHLELTALRGFCESLDFATWIGDLTQAKYTLLGPEDYLASARWGALEAVRFGVTTVGDASDSCQVVRALVETGLSGVVFQEVFGPAASQCAEKLQGLLEAVAGQEQVASGSLVKVGVSPHSPYTVSECLLRATIEIARERRLPVSMHAAESRAEGELVRAGRGPLAERLRARGIAVSSLGRSTIDYLSRAGALTAQPLLVHCVDVDDADLELIACAGASIAHCPRSNAKLGHGFAPVLGAIQRGIRVGLGTDGAVSSNSCDLLEEARLALLLQRGRLDPAASASDPELQAATFLRHLTLGGAEALGLDAEVGSLEPGKLANVIAIRLDGPGLAPARDPETSIIFSTNGWHNVFTMIGGRILYQDGGFPHLDATGLERAVNRVAEKLPR